MNTLIIEKVEGEWPEWAKNAIYRESLRWFPSEDWHGLADEVIDVLDALAEAQPFPPAGR